VGGDANAPGGPVLLQAIQVLREQCMQKRGFHYVVTRVSPVSALPSATGYPSTFDPQPLAGPYPETALLALRQREGFGIALSAGAQGHDPDPNDRYVSTLSIAQQRRWRAAWMGQNGCYGQAETRLFGSRQAGNREDLLPTTIYDELSTAVYAPDGSISPSHTATRTAATAWSRCMKTTTGRAWTDESSIVSRLTGRSVSSITTPASKVASIN